MSQTIIIVGGGFSGTMTAVHLLRGGRPGGLHVVLVNRSGPLARGVAYGTRSTVHTLNVPAGRMSAFPDDPDHFLRFARERDPSITGGTFAPRSLYGEYLEWVLREAQATSSPSTRFTHYVAAVVDLRLLPGGGVQVSLDGGRELRSDRVVLAAGSYPPADPPVPDRAVFAADPRYVRDPWAPGSLDAVDPDRPVLLIGTGLTMLDIASYLHGRGLRAPIYALSRRGLLPRPHRSPASPPLPVELGARLLAGPGTIRSYLRTFRRCLADCPDVDWRDVLASIRPVTPALWRGLPDPEKVRFLRHLQPYWEVHRHRAAPGITASTDELTGSGKLRVVAGRLLRLEGAPDAVVATFRRRGYGGVEAVRVGTVVNCTGPNGNVATLGEPLLDSLVRQGLLTPDPLGLGIRTAADHALLDREGRASTVLFYVGPMLKAEHWESTAVPELRVHAAQLAAHLRGIRVPASPPTGPAGRLRIRVPLAGGAATGEARAPIERALASWTRASSPSALREILPLLARPGLLSFALGMPAAELLPSEAYAQATRRALAADPLPLQYGVPYEPLKRQIVEIMAERGVRCREEQVFLTTGAQQGMCLLARLLLEEGGRVAVEAAVYDGIHNAVRPFRPEIVTVPSDAHGIDVDALEALLEGGARPAFVYLIPEGHNPLGVSLGLDRRLQLVELARRFEVPLVEDDAYGLLHYGEAPLPPLRALDPDWVLYVGSFSKILAPGLRVGWTVVPESLVPALSVLKHGIDLDVSSVSQRCIAEFLGTGALPAHLARLRVEYRTRRDAMLGALERHFPEAVRWNVPSAGMFVWASLPAGSDTVELLRRAVASEQVAFVPGAAFCAHDPEQAAHCMRLCFANVPAETIEDGVSRLARLVDTAAAKPLTITTGSPCSF
ncbi:MAG TPA: aminotransferase class I/II-fold pyridoxal phosphate-dependent enzyme [Longimicrobiaceae bacterium]|nr:aminotransferase class I/II-fold pyridoxal phosphate-dependent enzyme [Longimicrobiaceae bacterium]